MEHLLANLHKILGHPFWIPELTTKTAYSRAHDDK